jgi:hypothetical protein
VMYWSYASESQSSASGITFSGSNGEYSGVT